MSKTFKQGQLLWPKKAFKVKAGRCGFTAHPGQSFWVTSSTLCQEQTGRVNIARSNQKIGLDFTLELARELFNDPALA